MLSVRGRCGWQDIWIALDCEDLFGSLLVRSLRLFMVHWGFGIWYLENAGIVSRLGCGGFRCFGGLRIFLRFSLTLLIVCGLLIS